MNQSFDEDDAKRVLRCAGYEEFDDTTVPYRHAVEILVENVNDAVDDALADAPPVTPFMEECSRCGKKFPTTVATKYCSVGCELGYAPGTWWR